MLKSALEFFKKEKIYIVLTLIVAAIVVYIAVSPQTRLKDMQESKAVEKFKASEKELQKQVKEKGSVQEYLRDHPEMARQVSALTLAFLLAFMAGLVFDGMFLFSPAWRERLQLPPPPFQTTQWKLSMLYKVIILFILASVLIGLTLGFLRHLSGDNPNSVNFFILMHTTLMDFCIFFLIKKVIVDAGGNWRELGFRIPDGKPLREVFFAWGAYSAIMPIFVLALLILVGIASLMHYEPPPHPLVNVFLEEEKRAQPLIVYSVILATVIGPVFEEIFFRGFCYNILKARFGVRAGMIVSSAFFALIHENSFAFWPIFILGMILCFVYEKRQSLLAPMVLHVSHNLIFIYYFFVAKDLVSLVK